MQVVEMEEVIQVSGRGRIVVNIDETNGFDWWISLLTMTKNLCETCWPIVLRFKVSAIAQKSDTATGTQNGGILTRKLHYKICETLSEVCLWPFHNNFVVFESS